MGRVGMFGGSYVGATQMLAAIAHPPHLAGICPVVTAALSRGVDLSRRGIRTVVNESWTSGLAQDTLNRAVRRKTNAMRAFGKFHYRNTLCSSLPTVSPESGMTHSLAPYFLDWLAHPNFDDYWKRWNLEEHYSEIRRACLKRSRRWYDIFLGGSLRNSLA